MADPVPAGTSVGSPGFQSRAESGPLQRPGSQSRAEPQRPGPPSGPEPGLLAQPTEALLTHFAAGRTTPGAGSAAALAGALAASLAQTVARHTLKAARSGKRREAYAPFAERAGELQEKAAALAERLRRAVEEDAAAFERFWADRTPEALREATAVPMAIAESCRAVAEIALELHDHGARSSRGEAAGAILGALAGGEAAAHVAHLNLRFAGEAEAEAAGRVRDLRRRLRELRAAAETAIYGA